jgi:hypothetical protein
MRNTPFYLKTPVMPLRTLGFAMACALAFVFSGESVFAASQAMHGDEMVRAPFTAQAPMEATFQHVAQKSGNKKPGRSKTKGSRGEKRKVVSKGLPSFSHCNFNECMQQSTVAAQICEDQKRSCSIGAARKGGDMCEPGYLCAQKLADCYLNVSQKYKECVERLGDGEAVEEPKKNTPRKSTKNKT